jgi:hypothetical protein
LKAACGQVEKQSAHFYSVDITEKEAKMGLVCRVKSTDRSKFKLLYFELEENGGLSLALQVRVPESCSSAHKFNQLYI